MIEIEKEKALKYLMPFGKYKGKTLAKVWTIDSAYLVWCFKNWDKKKCPDFFWACDVLGITD